MRSTHDTPNSTSRQISLIGPNTRVQGRVGGDGDLEIAGHVEGSVTLPHGELRVSTTGELVADVEARCVVVEGAVHGKILAQERLVLESGARIVGELRSPCMVIHAGALVRGFVKAGPNAFQDPPPAEAVSTLRSSRSSLPSAVPAPAARPTAPRFFSTGGMGSGTPFSSSSSVEALRRGTSPDSLPTFQRATVLTTPEELYPVSAESGDTLGQNIPADLSQEEHEAEASLPSFPALKKGAKGVFSKKGSKETST